VSAEILTTFHLDRFIIPCVTDDTPLPLFFGRPVYLDLRTADDAALDRLVKAADAAPAAANPVPPRVGSPSAELLRERDRLAEGQLAVTDPLGRRDLAAAARAQRALDARMAKAEARWKYELDILLLGGYHRKNAYMVKHWDEIQAGRPPSDPVLLDAERRFFEAGLVDPTRMEALNGLASILVFELELDAADFFNGRARAMAANAGVTYEAAEQDRVMIAWMREQAARRR
jgi:hypothetical protein